MFAAQAEGKPIRTVEGLARGDELHPMQRAFMEHHGLQCGFCTPGFLMLAVGVLEREPDIGDEELLDVHRELFDAIRAVEPAFQRGDHKEYLRRLNGKLPKLRRASEFFSREFRRASTHTNFEMAALSLQGIVRTMEEVFAAVVADVPSTAAGDVAPPRSPE